MVIKMLNGLEERVDELSENFNTDSKFKKPNKTKPNQSESKNNLNQKYTTGNQ